MIEYGEMKAKVRLLIEQNAWLLTDACLLVMVKVGQTDRFKEIQTIRWMCNFLRLSHNFRFRAIIVLEAVRLSEEEATFVPMYLHVTNDTLKCESCLVTLQPYLRDDKFCACDDCRIHVWCTECEPNHSTQACVDESLQLARSITSIWTGGPKECFTCRLDERGLLTRLTKSVQETVLSSFVSLLAFREPVTSSAAQLTHLVMDYVGDVRALFSCGGCGVPNYCSPKCKDTDWRCGHRFECANIRTFFDSNSLVETLF